MASFGPIARHYDLLMAQIPYDMWQGYYRLLLSAVDSTPHRLLDVCCGTGTVAELLTKDGYEVAGVDLSEEMIRMARWKAEVKGLPIRYWVDNACTMDLGETFEGAYSFFDSFNYIIDPDDFAAAIARTAAHLEPGAWFVFDLNTEFAFTEKMFDQYDKRKKAAIQYEWKGDYDPGTRIIRVDMKFWKDGEEFTECHVQRAHTHEEVLAALAAAGFTQVRSYESYTLDPLHSSSDRVHYMGKRR